MKQFILSVLFIITICINTKAQLTHSISLGPELSIPGKNFGKSNLGFGGSFEYMVKFNAPVGIQFHFGYSGFPNKFYSNSKISFLPVRLGLVGFIYQDLIFVSADAGISHYHSPSTVTDQNGFSFGAGGGYKLFFDPEKKQFVQLSAYFNMHNFRNDTFGQNYNYGWFNIRAAYGLSWGKKIKTED